MAGPVPAQRRLRDSCPPWCVADHSAFSGEEAWVHLGEPVPITDGVTARLCQSGDPARAGRVGPGAPPVVLVGATEYSLAEVDALGRRLAGLAAAATRPAAV